MTPIFQNTCTDFSPVHALAEDCAIPKKGGDVERLARYCITVLSIDVVSSYYEW